MFARVKTQTNQDGSVRRYLQLVESVRVDGRPRQRVVATLGRLDELAAGGLDRLVQSLAQFAPLLQVIEALSAIAADAGRAWGLVLVARALWERLGLGPRLQQPVQQAEHTVPLDEAIFAMVVNRLADPHQSKRGTLAWLPTVWEPRWAPLDLHHLYRGLDVLAEVGPALERVIVKTAIGIPIIWNSTWCFLTPRRRTSWATPARRWPREGTAKTGARTANSSCSAG
jgi:hypothetical protein